MSTTRLRLRTESLSAVHWAAIALAAISGAIHLVIATGFITEALGIGLLLAGLGFFGGILLVLLGYRRRAVYAAGIPFTAVQIALWYWLNYGATGEPVTAAGPLEVVDKIAQVALVALLALLLARDE